jgi:hypothetical protein
LYGPSVVPGWTSMDRRDYTEKQLCRRWNVDEDTN